MREKKVKENNTGLKEKMKNKSKSEREPEKEGGGGVAKRDGAEKELSEVILSLDS